MDIDIFNQALNLTLIGVTVAFGLLLFLMFSAYFTSFLTKKVLNIINDRNTKNFKKLELEALNKSKAAVAVVTLLIADSQMSKES